jgi:hypothetical protein
VRAAVARGNVVIGNPIEVLSTEKVTMMNPGQPVPPPPATPAYTLPSDPEKALATIADTLGLPADAEGETFLAAVQALVDARDATDPAKIAVAARRLGLSEREVENCVALRVPPARYLANKGALQRAQQPRR